MTLNRAQRYNLNVAQLTYLLKQLIMYLVTVQSARDQDAIRHHFRVGMSGKLNANTAIKLTRATESYSTQF